MNEADKGAAIPEEYRSVYLEELEELLRLIEEEILYLERNGRSEASIQRLFRAAHTLKGSSAVMGYHRLKELTHNMENLLQKVRNGETPVSRPLTHLFIECLDRMRLLQAEVTNDQVERSEIQDLVLKLSVQLAEEAVPMAKQAIPKLPSEIVQKAVQAQSESLNVIWLSVSLASTCQMVEARRYVIDLRMRSAAEVLWVYLPADQAEVPQAPSCSVSHWLLATAQECPFIEQLAKSVVEVEFAEAMNLQPFDLEQAYESESADSSMAGPSTTEPLAPSVQLKSPTIRVNIERLESLMNLVGELVIDQTRIRQMELSFQRKWSGEAELEEFGLLTSHLARTIGELQDSIMKIRMLPIEQLYNRFPRMVRDLSLSLGKRVELLLEGRETELDRTLIEDIHEPLIHLLRNCIDHGIELPEQRLRAGKKEQGIIRVSAAHENNQIVIRVEDDGKGIDLNKLRQQAADKGIASPSALEQWSVKETLMLVFQPGLSTASQVNDISGRGVGMDIVRTVIERMNGSIDVESTLGAGTCFTIKLPLTLAIITGLLVTSCNRTFALPMSHVAETLRIAPSDIRVVRGAPIISLRGKILPLLWLHEHFGYQCKHQDDSHISVVIIKCGEKRMAIAVDELLGIQEIVIKSLGGFIGKMDTIAGATILGDGKVALILEIDAIMNSAPLEPYSTNSHLQAL